MNVNFADETRRNCKKKLGSQCLCNESNREKIYRVLRINATHAMSVKKKKKTCFARKGTSVATQKIYTHNSAEQLKRLKNRFFALSLSENKTFLFLFLSFFFFCCIFTFHLLCFECVFQWDASEKLPALLYSSFTLCSLPISW